METQFLRLLVDQFGKFQEISSWFDPENPLIDVLNDSGRVTHINISSPESKLDFDCPHKWQTNRGTTITLELFHDWKSMWTKFFLGNILNFYRFWRTYIDLALFWYHRKLIWFGVPGIQMVSTIIWKLYSWKHELKFLHSTPNHLCGFYVRYVLRTMCYNFIWINKILKT